MNVKFCDPLSSAVLVAESPGHLTADAAVHDLIAAGFIAPIARGTDYSLVNSRTRRALLPSQSFDAAGVREGDVIEVVQSTQGAWAFSCA